MLTGKSKAHLILVTAFILGVAVGASGQYLLSNQSPPPHSSTVADVTDELARVLKLDQSQRLQVNEILNECQRQNQDLRKQTRSQFQVIRENARNRIRSALSAEQLAVYNQWAKDLDAKREKKTAEEGKQTNK